MHREETRGRRCVFLGIDAEHPALVTRFFSLRTLFAKVRNPHKLAADQ